MSPESYSWEIREAAEELYIIDGLTFDQVAERTGVSASQLKRWGLEAVPTWSERRREYRQAQSSVRRNVMLAKAKLIESVIESEDPMKAFAFNSLVKSGQAIEGDARAARAASPNAAVAPPNGAGEAQADVIKTPSDAVAALQQAVQQKITTMLTSPGSLSFAAIKDTKAALEMIEQLQSKYVPAEESAVVQGGLSDEAAAAIRRQILGLSK